MTLPNLMSIKGIGKKRFAKIMTVMTTRDLSLEDVYQMSAADVKTTFQLPIHISRRIANVKTAAGQQPVSDKSDGQTTVPLSDTPVIPDKLPAVDRPLTTDDIRTLTPDDTDYPQRLRAVLGDDAPAELHIWGNLDLLKHPAIGFCGSRNVSEKGLQVTEDVTRQISDLKWVTVSGHARGVDTKAHLTALKNQAGTIIVLPQGLNGFKLRMPLRSHMTMDNVLLISEFPPYARWHVGYAMQRNATIIGLSDAMVLVESRSKGGTFNAGKTALQLRHPLFVVHFQNSSHSNAGNQYFLQRGATQLLKNRQTGRANINPLCEVVRQRIKSDTQSRPVRQMRLNLDSNNET